MAVFASYDDIPPERVRHHRGSGGDHPSSDVYQFIGAPKDRSPGPNAFLVRYIPGTSSTTHYHAADQMQIVVEGKGVLGHHELTPYQVHFARAYTPYGPLLPDHEQGWAFLTLRTRPDPEGAQRLSVARDKLVQIRDRRPFQTTCKVTFREPVNGVAIEEIPGLGNEEGLRGFALTLAPGSATTAPPAAASDGQYLLAVEGELVHDGRLRKALTIAFVGADEAPLRLQAGPSGLKAMILNFPQVAPTAAQVAADTSAATRCWQCQLCGFVYDEAAGMPDEGIPPGTPWDKVPDSWTCPDCGAVKSDFVMVEI